jgi:hypothetical protein
MWKIDSVTAAKLIRLCQSRQRHPKTEILESILYPRAKALTRTWRNPPIPRAIPVERRRTVTATREEFEAAWFGGRNPGGIPRGARGRGATMATGAELWRERGSRREEEARRRDDGTAAGNSRVRHGERRTGHQVPAPPSPSPPELGSSRGKGKRSARKRGALTFLSKIWSGGGWRSGANNAGRTRRQRPPPTLLRGKWSDAVTFKLK